MELEGNGTVSYNGIFSSGKSEFYYVKIIQDDEDRAWTAPVWINHPESGASVTAGSNSTIFYWTKSTSSRVYHKAGCPSIPLIKAENLQSGNVPPAGRQVHACNIMGIAEH
jgi:hypothetical protein